MEAAGSYKMPVIYHFVRCHISGKNNLQMKLEHGRVGPVTPKNYKLPSIDMRGMLTYLTSKKLKNK